MAKRAFQKFKAKIGDHDTSASAYQQRRQELSALRPRSTSVIRGSPATFSASAAPVTRTGPYGTTKTTHKVPGVVKVEEEEVSNKDPKAFQPLQLSAQPFATQ